MVGSILLNPQLIVYSFALGKTILLIRILSSILCGIIAGLLVRFFYKNKQFFTFLNFKESENRDTNPNIFIRLLSNIWRNIKATWFYFFL
jgi:uncharacterized membrane protein YraQ (UPF0718 family)